MTVLPIVTDTEIEEHTFIDILYANITERDIMTEDIITIVDSYAALIVYLFLTLL
jgi:hypothetical protein